MSTHDKAALEAAEKRFGKLPEGEFFGADTSQHDAHNAGWHDALEWLENKAKTPQKPPELSYDCDVKDCPLWDIPHAHSKPSNLETRERSPEFSKGFADKYEPSKNPTPVAVPQDLEERLLPLTREEVISTLKEAGVNMELEELRMIVAWESEGKIKKPRRDGRIWVSKTEFEALKREALALSERQAILEKVREARNILAYRCPNCDEGDDLADCTCDITMSSTTLTLAILDSLLEVKP